MLAVLPRCDAPSQNASRVAPFKEAEPKYPSPNEPKYPLPNEPKYPLPNEPKRPLPNEPNTRYRMNRIPVPEGTDIPFTD